MDELMEYLQTARRSGGWFGAETKRVRALEQIAELGQPKHAAWILTLVVEEGHDVAIAAAKAIAQLMGKGRAEGLGIALSVVPLNRLAPAGCGML